MIPTKDDFEKRLDEILDEARSRGDSYADVTSGGVHRDVGGYPEKNHRMPLCCQVMKKKMGSDDIILKEPPSGQGVILIRYFLKKDPEIIEKFKDLGRSEDEIRNENPSSKGKRLYYPNFEKAQTKFEEIMWGIASISFAIIAVGITAFVFLN